MVVENDDGEYADEHGDNIQNHLGVCAADGVLNDGGAETSEEGRQDIERAALFTVNACIRAEADVQQHKADGGGDADADAGGDGLNYFLTDGEKGQDDEENALDENDADSGGEGLLIA